MPRTRKDVWGLGDGWSDTLLWYAKAVGEMKGRALADKTSWRFLAAMHGVNPPVWSLWGYYDPQTDAPPSQSVIARYLEQCQHQSWYFLPWHRGYLAAFEGIVRATIDQLGGPAQDWALPYWNYNNPDLPRARELPPVFAEQTLPDGADNPLFVPQRYFDGSASTELPDWALGLDALNDETYFTADADGVPPGFGGPETIFHHGGEDDAVNGGLESTPHNNVHGAIGGGDPAAFPNLAPDHPANQGMMSMPSTAALDPVFWLHHANIDRLWEVWRKRDADPADPAAHTDPTEDPWLDGPVARPFVMPKPDGSEWRFAPKDVLDTEAPELDYIYEDLRDPFIDTSRVARRMTRLGVGAPAAAGIVMAGPRRSELIGSSEGGVRLAGGPVEASVRLDPAGTAKVASSLAAPAVGIRREPDRVFLRLENIRGANDSAAFEVYVGVPPDEDPEDYPDNRAGVVTLFGVRQATLAREASTLSPGRPQGSGITQVLEITDIVDRLHLAQGLDLQQLSVRFLPLREVRPEAQISVGRISIYRQGAP